MSLRPWVYKNKVVRFIIFLIILTLIAMPFIFKKIPSQTGLQVESIRWDADKLDSVIRFSNGKEISGVGQNYQLENLQSFVARDDQDNSHHIFLFKRTCHDCDEGPDMVVYDYDTDSSEAMALPGAVHDLKTNAALGLDRIFVGTCRDDKMEIVDFWYDVSRGEDMYIIEEMGFTSEKPVLLKNQVDGQAFRSQMALLPKPGCQELLLH